MDRRIDLPTLHLQPDTPLNFRFGPKTYQGFKGDSIATALYANGIRVFSRSLKYRRPRGLYGLDGACINPWVTVDGLPNVPADTEMLQKDIAVTLQNGWRDPQTNPMAFGDKWHWDRPAGWYDKRLHKTAWIWPFAVDLMRRVAGLGRFDPEFRVTTPVEKAHLQADVCVVGGGAAGMRAALSAAQFVKRVILLETRPHLGGCFDYRTSLNQHKIALYQRARGLGKMVEMAANIRVFKQTTAIGLDQGFLISAVQETGDDRTKPYARKRSIKIKAQAVIVATGCLERPALFENNDLPGVMQVSCAHRLARTWGILPGEKAVFGVGDDLGLEAAVDLFDLGLSIDRVIDYRKAGHNPELITMLAQRQIPFFPGGAILKAYGKKHLNKVTVILPDHNQKKTIPCDLLVTSSGLDPQTGLLQLGGGKLRFDPQNGLFGATDLPLKLVAAGRLLGLQDPDLIEISGHLKALEAIANDIYNTDANQKRMLDAQETHVTNLRQRGIPSSICNAPLAVQGHKAKIFIYFDEDVTLKEIDRAMAMGLDRSQLIERFTSARTGPGQGGLSNHNLALYVSSRRKKP